MQAGVSKGLNEVMFGRLIMAFLIPYHVFPSVGHSAWYSILCPEGLVIIGPFIGMSEH